jgi:hypothetical protein
MKKIFVISGFIITVIILIYSFKPVHTVSDDKIVLLPEFSTLKSGDIIFRDGRGVMSNAFKKFSLTSPEYSHAGIIHIEKNNAFVYHTIGGEDNKSNEMQKEPLINFCSSYQANSFAIYRTIFNGSAIDSIAGNYFNSKLEFDTSFDLYSEDKMYCTELVYKILNKVSQKNNFIPLTTVSGIRYVACDNIFLSPCLKLIFTSQKFQTEL